ncbi:MAG: lysophospholipid acyltransferase family protein [Thermostichales cyanobacterium SZTDM-1c_bins_54]
MASRYRQSDWICYWLLKWLLVNPAFRLLFQGRIQGSLPRSGPLIVVSNHASHLDPPLVANAARRPVAFMAKEELFRVPLLSQVIRLYGAYPVRRGGADRRAIQAAQQALARGWAVGIFLNGTRSLTGRVETPHLGAALIAAQTQTPLVPVALWGTERIQPKGRKFPRLFAPITVRIGDPIPPPPSTDRQELQAVTDRCVAAIHHLLEQGR